MIAALVLCTFLCRPDPPKMIFDSCFCDKMKTDGLYVIPAFKDKLAEIRKKIVWKERKGREE